MRLTALGKVTAGLVLGAILSGCPAEAKQRLYYIAADEVLWNYAPSGTNMLTGAPLQPGENQLGFTYHKVVYHAYSDGTFATLKVRPDAESYLGILGPPIRAEVLPLSSFSRTTRRCH
jgi:hephaestin